MQDIHECPTQFYYCSPFISQGTAVTALLSRFRVYLSTCFCRFFLCRSYRLCVIVCGILKMPQQQSKHPCTISKRSGVCQHAAMTKAFDNAGKKAGLEIWRIEKFDAVPYPKKDYGKFYVGDSYIVLYTKEKVGNFTWDIHFWLGAETSQDEAGSAAMLSVHLDDKLGGGPIQYREVQDHESQVFLSHFKSGVRYVPGGIASGFKHVDLTKYEKKLYHIKGKRNVRVKQVALSIKSMNKGDGFVLDTGKDVYVYVGIHSKRAERIKSIEVGRQVRDQDHAGKSTVHIIDEFCDNDEIRTFFKAMGGGSLDDVPEEAAGGDDEAFEKTQERSVMLSRISDASGRLKIEHINKKPLLQSMLDTDDCFILETSDSNIFVWVGKKCTNTEKTEAMNKAQQFMKEKKYPTWTQVQRIVENGEPASFRQYFQSWKITELQAHHFSPTKPKEVKNAGEAQEYMPDDGSGDLEIFRMENREPVAVPKEMYGKFFGGDSYLVKYHYKGSYIIYIWQGNESTNDEKASSAIYAIKMDDDLGGKPTQIRVSQGYEPKHFLHIFKGKLVTFIGGKASGFKNTTEQDSYLKGSTCMFRIRGTNEFNVRGTQQLPNAKYLASDDVFIVSNGQHAWIWMGKGCDKVERNLAEGFACQLVSNIKATIVEEGDEPQEFWQSIGGKQAYNTVVETKKIEAFDPILFHGVVTKNDDLKLEEISNFDQSDLVEDDIMILDGGGELFVWIGKGADDQERKLCTTVAQKYLEKQNRTNAVTIVIKQGEEPTAFTSYFPNWNANAWKTQQSYDSMKSKINFALIKAKFNN